MTRRAAHGWLTPSAVLSIAAGIAVLVALVWQVGPEQIREGLAKVGWVFLAIVALGGLRFLVRAIAWTLCIERPHRLRIRDAFAAVLAGDALGNATPLGPVVGEPAKVVFARTHIATAPALTALAVENLFYTLSTAGMIAAGTLALLFTFELPGRIREYTELGLMAIGLGVGLALVVLWRRPAVVSRWVPVVSRPGTRLHSLTAKLHALEQDIYSFASRRRRTVLPVAALEIGFHALGVLETHVTMWVILGEPLPILTSFVLETASRLITVLFKFVPLQLGVAEAGLATMTELLGLGTASGLTFSLVRKARVGVWAVIGAGLLLRRGITPGLVLSDPHLQSPPKNT